MTGNSKHSKIFQNSFHDKCVKLIVSAYRKSITEKPIDVNWQENDITVHLHEYIDKDQFRKDNHISTNVEHHLPDENLPKEAGFADRYSRIDMRFAGFKSKVEYLYFAEAKLLRALPKINTTYCVPTVAEYNSSLCGICLLSALSPTSVHRLYERPSRTCSYLIRIGH
jgi:hypothetical protein